MSSWWLTPAPVEGSFSEVQREPPQAEGTDLRTNLEVILLIIPVDVPLRACANAPGSWDGEAGGPL